MKRILLKEKSQNYLILHRRFVIVPACEKISLSCSSVVSYGMFPTVITKKELNAFNRLRIAYFHLVPHFTHIFWFSALVQKFSFLAFLSLFIFMLMR